MKDITSTVARRFASFRHAFRGVRTLFSTQPNARLHAGACLLVIIWGAFLHLETVDWCFVLVCIGMVLGAEALNTAVEFLGDEVSLEHRERIGRAKDVAAAAVLIASLTSLAVWGMILWKRVG